MSVGWRFCGGDEGRVGRIPIHRNNQLKRPMSPVPGKPIEIIARNDFNQCTPQWPHWHHDDFIVASIEMTPSSKHKNADLRAAQPIPWRRVAAAMTAAVDSSQLD